MCGRDDRKNQIKAALSPKDMRFMPDMNDRQIDKLFNQFCAKEVWMSECGSRLVFNKNCKTKMYYTGINGILERPEDDFIL